MQNQKTRSLSLGVKVDRKSLQTAEQDLRRLLGPEALAKFEQAQAREALARAKRSEEALKREREAAARRASDSVRREWDGRIKLEVSQGHLSQDYYKLYLRNRENDEELSYRKRHAARREYLRIEQSEETRARRAQGQSFSGRVNTLVRSTRFTPGQGIAPLLGRTADVFGAGGLAIATALPLLGSLTKKASDLTETINKSQVVFGSYSKSIEAWGETSAKAFGLSKQAAIEQASTLGNLLRSAGLTQGQAADQSKDLVKLAADLASFNNIAGGTDEVLADIRSAMTGETEPIRKYGVLLSEATVKAEALRLGLVKATGDTEKIGQAQRRASVAQAEYSAAVKRYGENSIEAQKKLTAYEKAQQSVEKATKGAIPELTEQQKVMARLSVLFQQTTTAQGDFARTAGEAANSQRILNAELDNLQARLGTKLLPLRKSFLQFLIDGADRAGELVTSLESIGKEYERLIAEGRQGELPAWLQNMLDASEAIRLNLKSAAMDSQPAGQAATIRGDLNVLRKYKGYRFINPLTVPDEEADALSQAISTYAGRDPIAGNDLKNAINEAIQVAEARLADALRRARAEVASSPQRTELNRQSSSYMMGLGELAKSTGKTLPGLPTTPPAGVKPSTGKPTAPVSGAALEKARKDAERKLKEAQEKAQKEAEEILDLASQISTTQLKASLAAAEAAKDEAQKRVEKAAEAGGQEGEIQKLLQELDAKNMAAILARQKIASEEYKQAIQPRKGDTEAIQKKRIEAADATLKATTDELIREESKYIAERKALLEKANKERQDRLADDLAIEAGTQESLQRAREDQAQEQIRAGRRLSELAVQRARETEDSLRDRGTFDQRRGAAAGTLLATTKALEEQLLAAFTTGDIAQVAESLHAMVQAQRDYTQTLQGLDEAEREELARLQASTDAASRRERDRRRASNRDTYEFDGKTYSVKTNEEVDPATIETINQLQQGATQAANTFLRNIITGKGSTGDLWKDLGQTFGDAAGDFLTRKLISGPLERFFEEIATKLAGSAVAGNATGAVAGGAGAAGGLKLGAAGSALLRNAGYAGLGIWGVNQLFGKRSPFKGIKLFAGGGTAYAGDVAGFGELGPELAFLRNGRAAMLGESGPGVGRISERMRIIDAQTTAQLMAAASGGGSGRQVVVSGPIMHVDTITDRGDADYSAHRALDLLMNRMEARGY